jgi:hypothetical protein
MELLFISKPNHLSFILFSFSLNFAPDPTKQITDLEIWGKILFQRLLINLVWLRRKCKNYQELEHFGNRLEQTLGDAERVLAEIIVKWNSKLGKPLDAVKFVVIMD